MSRISLAFKAFFAILFGDRLPEAVAQAYGYSKQAEAPKPAPKPTVEVRTSEGALQMLAILQRDSRLIDFLMEDISGYEDEQVGAAVRTLHGDCRQTLTRYVTLRPIIDGVEGTPTRVETRDAQALKLIGNVPADGKVGQGILRHKGWRAEKVDLPRLTPNQNVNILAPAEIEVE
ncbi:MAG: DUF2760 domain-containing protein [Acidobacteria bacterium]|nr:DUF2760 domain-containing protein [Acidobacteriota bacterium]